MAWLSRNPNFCAFLCKHWVNVLAVYILSLFSFKFHQHFASNNFLFVTKYETQTVIVQKSWTFVRKTLFIKCRSMKSTQNYCCQDCRPNREKLVGQMVLTAKEKWGLSSIVYINRDNRWNHWRSSFFSKKVSRNLNFLKVFCESYERVGFRNHGNISCRGGPEGLKKYFIIKDLT